MQDARKAASAGISRRHLVTGALGAAALPIVTPAFGRGVEAPATAADEGFMRIALEEAALGDDPYFFGAVIVRDGEVLARGRNLGTSSRTRPRMPRWLPCGGSSPRRASRNSRAPRSTPRANPARCAWARSCGAASRGWSMAPRSPQLATKIGQIMLTDAEIADKTPFADIALTGGVLAEESMKLFK